MFDFVKKQDNFGNVYVQLKHWDDEYLKMKKSLYSFFEKDGALINSILDKIVALEGDLSILKNSLSCLELSIKTGDRKLYEFKYFEKWTKKRFGLKAPTEMWSAEMRGKCQAGDVELIELKKKVIIYLGAFKTFLLRDFYESKIVGFEFLLRNLKVEKEEFFDRFKSDYVETFKNLRKETSFLFDEGRDPLHVICGVSK